MFSFFLEQRFIQINIVSSPNCACGVPREDAFHFFFECSKYTDIRRDLLICINRFRMKIDLALVTRGNQNLTYEDNWLIFKEVYKFIRRSKRFLTISFTCVIVTGILSLMWMLFFICIYVIFVM